MNTSLYTWTLRMVVESLAKGRVTISAPKEDRTVLTVANPQAVLDFLETARAGMPLGMLTWAETDANRYEIVDGRQRVNALARVMVPELFPDPADHWPVLMLPPDHPRAGQLAWGTEPDWGQDPAALPLSACFLTMSFLAWEQQLRNRTPDDGKIKAALNGAYALNKELLDAKIAMCVIRGTDAELSPERLSRLRRRANSSFEMAHSMAYTR